MCDICTDGIVGQYESESVHCTFCSAGIEAQLAEMSVTLLDYAAELITLDAQEALGMLDREGIAARDAIEDEFKRLCFEHDALEAKLYELAVA